LHRGFKPDIIVTDTMFSLNKFEAVGIIGSIAVFSLLLMLVNQQTQVTELPEVKQEGAIVVATDDTEDDELSNALEKAQTEGELTELVIQDVRIGQGKAVENGDTLVVNYIGSTQDGVQFDSSYKRGEPFIFTVGRGIVIQGWDKGVIGMREGGQRILVIPSEMGYGNRQIGTIPPNSTLVFAVELLEIR